MPKKNFIDRKSAKHYHVVHRSQKDPLINDSEASARVLQEVVPPNLLKHKTPEELKKINARPTKLTQDEIDQRVGQAALYGVYFDDAEYDYMQHMKPIGASDAVFLEAPTNKKDKPKRLDGILLRDEVESGGIFDRVDDKKNPKLFDMPAGVLPSRIELDKGVMNQQTGLEGGLQPDMDPRLREVLEALEDEEYVEDNLEEDFFGELNDDTVEPYDPEEDEYYEDSEEEYEDYEEEEQVADPENYDWQTAFNKFKRSQARGGGADSDEDYDNDDKQSKGTGFSISSSAMHRTTQLRTLDDRFDKIEEEYMRDDDDEDDEYYDGDVMEEREDFESILDDFLEKYEVVGNKLATRLEGEDSAQKLDAIRGAFDTLHLVEEEEKREQEHQQRKERALAAAATTTSSSSKKESEDLWARPEQRKHQTWDCQSVISTYSNLENHPHLISDRGPRKKITIDPKTGMPILMEVDRKKQKSKKKHYNTLSDDEDHTENGQNEKGNKDADHEEDDEEDEDEDEDERANLGERRSKAETTEEKRQRKQAIKEAKKNRREEKKSTKAAFKSEESRQKQTLIQQRKAKGVQHIM